MESTDLRNILSGPETNTEAQEETPKIKNSDKHILNKSFPQEGDINVNDFLELEEEIVVENSMYDKEWTKLEKGMKLNRLLVFITSETKERQLTDTQAQALKQLLFKACDMGLFNKINDVKYNTETGIIESIKQLEFNDTSHKYKLKTGGSKGRSVSKSRSNIDRLMKK